MTGLNSHRRPNHGFCRTMVVFLYLDLVANKRKKNTKTASQIAKRFQVNIICHFYYRAFLKIVLLMSRLV